MVEKIEYNNEGACPCKHCKRAKQISYPIVEEVGGLFYARCTGCQHYDPNTFLGITKKNSIRVWNELMETKGNKDD